MITYQADDNSKQNSQKRARSNSQTSSNPWKHSNVNKDWNTYTGSSGSQEQLWSQASSYWQQGWASDPYRHSGSTSTSSTDRSFQHQWQQYPATDNSFWAPASSSSSGALGFRDNLTNRSREGSRGPVFLRSRQQLSDDLFQ